MPTLWKILINSYFIELLNGYKSAFFLFLSEKICFLKVTFGHFEIKKKKRLNNDYKIKIHIFSNKCVKMMLYNISLQWSVQAAPLKK